MLIRAQLPTYTTFSITTPVILHARWPHSLHTFTMPRVFAPCLHCLRAAVKVLTTAGGYPAIVPDPDCRFRKASPIRCTQRDR